MARDFGGDAILMRKHSSRALERDSGRKHVDVEAARENSVREFCARALAQSPGLRAWTREEKEDLVQVIRAKSKPDEMLYLHLTQRHERLRSALLMLGS